MPHFANIAVSILFDGLAYAMFLFIISVGLSVTMGLMGFVNLAHGAFAMAGGYLVVTAARELGVPFPPGARQSPSVVVGAVERRVRARCSIAGSTRRPSSTRCCSPSASPSWRSPTYTYFYGPIPQIGRSCRLARRRQIDLGFAHFPSYRVFLIVVGAALIAVLWYGFERTNIGAKIRAAVDNRRMAQSVGINVDLLFTLTFAVGCGLAALGGGLAIQLFGLTPSFAVLYLVLFLIVVAVGGLGSLKGTLLAALVLGIFDTAGKYLSPTPAAFSSTRSPSLVLLVKPAGFYGRE